MSVEEQLERFIDEHVHLKSVNLATEVINEEVYLVVKYSGKRKMWQVETPEDMRFVNHLLSVECSCHSGH